MLPPPAFFIFDVCVCVCVCVCVRVCIHVCACVSSGQRIRPCIESRSARDKQREAFGEVGHSHPATWNASSSHRITTRRIQGPANLDLSARCAAGRGERGRAWCRKLWCCCLGCGAQAWAVCVCDKCACVTLTSPALCFCASFFTVRASLSERCDLFALRPQCAGSAPGHHLDPVFYVELWQSTSL